MTTQHHDTVDPAVAAWSSAAPQAQLPAPAPEVYVPAEASPWRWGWNWFIGIHYGPIPVGLLVALPILIALRT